MGIRKPRRWAQGAGTRLEDDDDQPPNTRRKPRVRAFFAVLSLWLAVAQPALAQGDALSIAQFRHSAWKSNNTVPSQHQPDHPVERRLSVDRQRRRAVAFRRRRLRDLFARHRRSRPPRIAPRHASDARRRNLGRAVLRRRRVRSSATAVSSRAGMPNPSRSVLELAQDLDDAIWVANARPVNGLSRFANGRWEELGRAEWACRTAGSSP
jgi:hypothetical protein